MSTSNNTTPNQIKIGASTRVRNVISYAQNLFKEKQFKEVTISAIGGAIGSLVNAVEVLKADIPGLHQVNKISTVSYQTVDPNQDSKIIQERLYPKLEVVLSIEEPKSKSEGYQKPISEEERKALNNFSSQRREQREQEPREDRRGRGRGRGRGFEGRGRGRGFEGRGRGRGSDERRGGRGFEGRGRGFEGRGRGRGYEGRGRGSDERRGGRGFEGRGRGRGFESRGGRGFESRGGRGFESRGGRGFESRGGRGFEGRGRGRGN